MATNDATPSRLVDELAEDLVVAIREFSERHPDTEPRRIRRALRLVERGMQGRRLRHLGSAVALLVALLSGVAVGLALR